MEISTCVTNPADRALAFSWQVEEDNGHGLKVDEVSKNSVELTVMKKTMRARFTYKFAFTAVSANNPDLKSTSISEVYVEPDVVIAQIAGGASRIIGLLYANQKNGGKGLSLDASTSYDLDDEKEAFRFSWECMLISDGNNTFCRNQDESQIQGIVEPQQGNSFLYCSCLFL